MVEAGKWYSGGVAESDEGGGRLGCSSAP